MAFAFINRALQACKGSGSTAPENNWCFWKIGPALIKIVFLGALIAAGWELYRSGLLRPDLLRTHSAPPARAIWMFCGIYALATLAGVPTLPFNLAAGVIWGAWGGAVLSATSTSLGATAAFFCSRFIFGKVLTHRFDNAFITWVQDELEAKGWKFVAFLRVNPIFPTAPLNYLLGLTSISGKAYILSTFIFLLPPSFAVALAGQQLGSIVANPQFANIARAILLLSAAVTIVIALRYAGKYYNRSRASK